MTDPGTTPDASVINFTCRLCRGKLFTDKDLEPHAAGAQRINRRKLGSGSLSTAANAKACTSYFLNEGALESLDWVRLALKAHDEAAAAGTATEAGAEGIEGKLICPNAKCGGRLGNFNWSGSQCSCGSWVVPAIQVVASKVDRKGREETEGLVVVDFGAKLREREEQQRLLEQQQQQREGAGEEGGREGEQEMAPST